MNFDDFAIALYRRRAQWSDRGVLWPSSTAVRRGAPISGFVGPNGGGKTYAMLESTIPSLRAGRTVLSTVRLLDGDNPRPCDDEACYCDKTDPVRHSAAHPCWVPWGGIDGWQQLLEADHCDVLADEVTGVASSRESSSLPAAIANLLVQLRRRDVVLRWTAPNWRRADVIIRECTQMVTVCTGFYPQMYQGEDERAWSQNRLFKLTSFDAALMDDFEAGKTDKLDAWTRQWIWRPKNDAAAWYDTYDSVSSIGSVSDSGRCLRCGGTRRAAPCSCADYADRKAAGPARKRSEDGVPASADIIPLVGGSARRALLPMAEALR